ncbi:MAG: AraC family transcriptional regulator [Proteobacteria bacterium]|nr:AraC family transcriptional regulator [Pseudomonadota bacterium]MCP4917336.1 AraC family transcriptional regulator [Pseudomonadota bacterium]
MPRQDMIDRAISLADGNYTPLHHGPGIATRTAPGTFEAMIYEPLVCLILQGEKRLRVSGRDEEAIGGAGQCIVVSHAMPVVSRITEARPERPYVSLITTLDVSELRELYNTVGDDPLDAEPACALQVTPTSELLLDVFDRWMRLAEEPADAPVLGPLIRRELHYRLLKADGGGMLRRLLRRDSHASNIARAIDTLRQGYRGRVEMDELARSVGMSASSFYKHFRSVTATTPLQYQKDLRLTEARRLLLGGDHSVSTAATAVGYESPSQFSREYSRKFGGSPRADLH